jgi:hypothetical protein
MRKQLALDSVDITYKVEIEVGVVLQGLQGRGDCNAETFVPAHCIYSEMDRRVQLLVVAALNYFATTVEAICSHMVTTMSFTSGLVYRQGRTRQGVVGATHSTTGTGLFAFLNCHDNSPAYLLPGFNCSSTLNGLSPGSSGSSGGWR